MDDRTLDSLARTIGATLTRRGMVGTLVGVAAFLHPASPETDARRKRKRRRKKGKCKQHRKRCGKTCIRQDQCCTAADCGAGGVCVTGACTCPAGQKSCGGRCVAATACCRHEECAAQQHCENGACVESTLNKRCGDDVIGRDFCCAGQCPGDQTCHDRLCVCPEAAMWPCPDGRCLAGGQCCVDSQCPGAQECVDGYCACPDARDVVCDGDCCDAAANEICASEPVPSLCAGGGCQLSDWCNTEDYQVCEDDGLAYCVCLTAFGATGPEHACIDYYSLYQDTSACESCTTSSDCDAGWACVQGSANANEGSCSCTGLFCAQVCNEEGGSLRAPRRGENVAKANARIAGMTRSKPRRTGR